MRLDHWDDFLIQAGRYQYPRPWIAPTFMAHCALQSHFGHTFLSEKHNNYSNMLATEDIFNLGNKIRYGNQEYVSFESIADFIKSFFGYHLHKAQGYLGKRSINHRGFIQYLSKKVIGEFSYSDNLFEATERIYEEMSQADPLDLKECGTSEQEKPECVWIASPNYSSRDTQKIKRIVLHYTTSDNVWGTVSWFKNRKSRVSAHYVLGRGKPAELVQMVRDGDKAWHARHANSDSIGIEICAKPKQWMTKEQSDLLARLIRYLIGEYKLKAEDITGHRFLGIKTSCPGDIFGDDSEEAMRQWIKDHV